MAIFLIDANVRAKACSAVDEILLISFLSSFKEIILIFFFLA